MGDWGEAILGAIVKGLDTLFGHVGLLYAIGGAISGGIFGGISGGSNLAFSIIGAGILGFFVGGFIGRLVGEMDNGPIQIFGALLGLIGGFLLGMLGQVPFFIALGIIMGGLAGGILSGVIGLQINYRKIRKKTMSANELRKEEQIEQKKLEIDQLEKIKKILVVSSSINREFVKKIIDNNTKFFTDNIWKLGSDFGITITNGYIELENSDVDGFISKLKEQFNIWSEKKNNTREEQFQIDLKKKSRREENDDWLTKRFSGKSMVLMYVLIFVIGIFGSIGMGSYILFLRITNNNHLFSVILAGIVVVVILTVVTISGFEIKKKWKGKKKNAKEAKQKTIIDEKRRIEKDAVEKVKKMMRVSSRVKLDMMRETFGSNFNIFYEYILDWAVEFGLKIDGDYIVIENADVDGFITKLDKQFAFWKDGEKDKDGKEE